MTEEQWLTCTDPTLMLEFLQGKVSDRKLRLFAGACCRGLLGANNEYARQAVEVVELFADGHSNKAALKRARQEVRAARHDRPMRGQESQREWSLCWITEVAATENSFAMVASEMSRLAAEGILPWSTDRQVACCSLLRDIVGPLPFRPVTIDPSLLRWNDGTVSPIAAGIYDARAFERMGILADALLDAGCDDEKMLQHCRQQEAVHTKGCWVLDLLLGKS